MKKDSLVVLRGFEKLYLQTDVFYPNRFYRSIEITENSEKQYLVYGIVFDEETFNAKFEYVHTKVIRDWEKIGLLENGKKLSYKAFKEKSNVHQYQSCRVRSKLNVVYFFKDPRDCIYGFYPIFREPKEQSLKMAYVRYLDILGGNVIDFDNGNVQFGNCGIPISYGDLRTS